MSAWEDELDRMMVDIPRRLLQGSRRRSQPEYPPEFYEPLEEEAPAPLQKVADVLEEKLAADHAYEPGQENPCAAFPFVSAQGLEDIYHRNQWHQCAPISGDATLKQAFPLLY